MKKLLLIAVQQLVSFFLFAQHIPEYSLQTDINPATGIAEGYLQIKWQATVTADSIPFVFNYNSEIHSLIKKATINNLPATIVAAKRDNQNGFFLIPKAKIPEASIVNIEFKFQSDTIKDKYNAGYLPVVDEWHPMIPHYRDGQFRWKEQELKNFTASISVPVSYKAATTGIIQKQEERNKKLTLFTTAEDVVYYGVCLSDTFLVDETETNGIKLYSYYFEHDAKWGRKLLEMARDVVSFYKKEIGFYPAKQLSILPGFDQPYGGYPISSNIFVIHRGLDSKGADSENFANWITAHEIAHYYWGFGYILTDGNYTDWLGIGMGIYTDWLYSTQKGLDMKVYDFDNRYMAGVLAGINTTILQPIDLLERAGFDYNNIIKHGKGFTVVQALEYLVGKEMFLTIYREGLKRFKGKTITAGNFKSLCEEISGRDLTDFFYQWLSTPAIVDYRISRTVFSSPEKGKFRVDCYIKRIGDGIAPIEIQAEDEVGNKIKIRIEGDFKDTSVVLELSNSPKEIVLDPDKRLPLFSRYENNPIIILQAASYANRIKSYIRAIALMESIKRDYNDNASYLFLYGQLLRKTGKIAEAVTYFEKILSFSSKDIYSETSILEIGIIYDLMGLREKAMGYYQKGLEIPSIKVRCAQYIKSPYQDVL